MIISLIAAVDENLGLGNNNELLCYLPADLRHFKSLTIDKTVIMGKNTYDSIGKPLPQRQNIILTRKKIAIEGALVADSFEKALSLVDKQDEVMVIGGALVYRETIALADKIYLTKIHHQFAADVFFPPIDKTLWRVTDKSFRPCDEKNNYDLTFYTYEREKLVHK